MNKIRIVQNGYVVQNMDKAIYAWNQMVGLGPFFVNESAEHPSFTYNGHPSTATFRTALVQAGDIQLELVQPTNEEPSVFRDVLSSSGEGLHHVRIAVEDYDAQIRQFVSSGFQPAMQGDVAGVVRFAFFDMRAELGHYIEISERQAPAVERDEKIAALCRAWDGRTLIRDVKSLNIER